MGQTTPLTADELFDEAAQMARTHNMFISRKGTRFELFRRTPSRPVFLGARVDALALRRLVSRCATTTR